MAKEMQQLNEVNESVCNETQHIGASDEQQKYKGPVTRSRSKALDQINLVVEDVPTHQDEGIPEEGLSILVHVERLEGGPMVTNLFQTDVIGEIIRGCVQVYPFNLDILNEMECVIEMPREMVASIVAQNLQGMNNGEV